MQSALRLAVAVAVFCPLSCHPTCISGAPWDAWQPSWLLDWTTLTLEAVRVHIAWPSTAQQRPCSFSTGSLKASSTCLPCMTEAAVTCRAHSSCLLWSVNVRELLVLLRSHPQWYAAELWDLVM